MTRLRILVLILGPAPIVAAALGVSGWMRPGAQLPFVPNDVVNRLSAPANVVLGADVPALRPAGTDPKETNSLDSRCALAASKLKAKIGEECHVAVHAPFVLAGDMSSEEIDRWYQHTVHPAARAMQYCYFKTAPSESITVLLFSSEHSYNHYADKLFGDADISVYGYYKPNLRTLVMNINTGGGTLVHELTHALIDFDFPRVPDWFNEGLASLHEQCQFREDSSGPWIEGLENWRLSGLQRTIREKRLRSLESLIQEDDFRGKLEGTNYAQARYLCLYLQRKGLLKEFFRRFRDNQKTDPLGHKTMAEVFPAQSWEELDRNFQKWVLALKES